MRGRTEFAVAQEEWPLHVASREHALWVSAALPGNAWTDFVEVHWADCGQMYVTPVDEDQVCVALITSYPDLRFDAALRQFAKLVVRLRDAEFHHRTIAAITASRRLNNVQSGRVALIGEAAGSVDAIKHPRVHSMRVFAGLNLIWVGCAAAAESKCIGVARARLQVPEHGSATSPGRSDPALA